MGNVKDPPILPSFGGPIHISEGRPTKEKFYSIIVLIYVNFSSTFPQKQIIISFIFP